MIEMNTAFTGLLPPPPNEYNAILFNQPFSVKAVELTAEEAEEVKEWMGYKRDYLMKLADRYNNTNI